MKCEDGGLGDPASDLLQLPTHPRLLSVFRGRPRTPRQALWEGARGRAAPGRSTPPFPTYSVGTILPPNLGVYASADFVRTE